MEIVLPVPPDVCFFGEARFQRRHCQPEWTSFKGVSGVELVEMSLISSEEAASASSRRRRRFKGDNVEQRARRAMVQLGEVSAGRQALDGVCLAPGDL